MREDDLREALWRATYQFSRIENDAYKRWIEDQGVPGEEEESLVEARVKELSKGHSVSLILVDEGSDQALEDTLASLRAQVADAFELVIACEQDRSDRVRAAVRGLSSSDRQVVITSLEARESRVAAEAKMLSVATGDFVGFLSVGDRLAPYALAAMRAKLMARPDVMVIYSDEDWIDENGMRLMPRFKTGWDPDAQLGFDLLGRLCLLQRRRVQEVGGLRPEMLAAAHYDLHCRVALELTPAQVAHIPSVLYHRRVPVAVESSRVHPIESYTILARVIASEQVAILQGEPTEVLPAPLAPFINRVRWPLPMPEPLVSILVPTRDMAALLRNCARGILEETSYPSLELLVLDNGSEEEETAALFAELSGDPRVRILPMPGPFNYSKINNDGVLAARGEVIVLMNNDVEVIHPLWLREMVALAMRPEIGCVGAKLLYGDRRVQHAGVVLQSTPQSQAMHAFHLHGRLDLGYDGQLAGLRSYLGVTAACLAIRRSVFQEVGGFDAEHLRIAYNDVDLCLKVGDIGYRNVCTPFVPLLHLESASRGFNDSPEKRARDLQELTNAARRWPDKFKADPFRSPNMTFRWNEGGALVLPKKSETWPFAV